MGLEEQGCIVLWRKRVSLHAICLPFYWTTGHDSNSGADGKCKWAYLSFSIPTIQETLPQRVSCFVVTFGILVFSRLRILIGGRLVLCAQWNLPTEPLTDPGYGNCSQKVCFGGNSVTLAHHVPYLSRLASLQQSIYASQLTFRESQDAIDRPQLVRSVVIAQTQCVATVVYPQPWFLVITFFP